MNQNGLVLWVLGGAGVTLLYAAYKGKSPLSVLQNHVAGTGAATPGSPVSATKPVNETLQQEQNSAQAAAQPVGAYTVQSDSTGTQYVYDANGSPVEELPQTYNNHPNSYIPPAGTVNP